MPYCLKTYNNIQQHLAEYNNTESNKTQYNKDQHINTQYIQNNASLEMALGIPRNVL